MKARESLIILFTGNGKGKTTAALGILLRAWGRGMSVVMLSFIKSRASDSGERRAAERLGIEMLPLGRGFTWLAKNLDEDRRLAETGWGFCQQKIESSLYDVVVLDEITYPINFGWLRLGDVLEVLKHRPAGVNVILTGRDAPQGLIDGADLVTEMREIKHPFRSGVKAQPGIDY